MKGDQFLMLSQCTVLWRWRMPSRSFSPLEHKHISFSFCLPQPSESKRVWGRTLPSSMRALSELISILIFHRRWFLLSPNITLNCKPSSQLVMCMGSSACQKSPIKLSHALTQTPHFLEHLHAYNMFLSALTLQKVVLTLSLAPATKKEQLVRNLVGFLTISFKSSLSKFRKRKEKMAIIMSLLD